MPQLWSIRKGLPHSILALSCKADFSTPQLPPQRSENFAGSESGELLEPELLLYALLSGAQSDGVHSCPIWVAGALTARKYPGTRSASGGGKGLKRRMLRDLGLPLSPSLLCSTPVFDPPTLV